MSSINKLGLATMSFQQDLAIVHTARSKIHIWKYAFPCRLMSSFGDLQWPPKFQIVSLQIPHFVSFFGKSIQFYHIQIQKLQPTLNQTQQKNNYQFRMRVTQKTPQPSSLEIIRIQVI